MTPVGVDQILPNVKLIFPPQATVTVWKVYEMNV